MRTEVIEQVFRDKGYMQNDYSWCLFGDYDVELTDVLHIYDRDEGWYMIFQLDDIADIYIETENDFYLDEFTTQYRSSTDYLYIITENGSEFRIDHKYVDEKYLY